MDDQMDSNDSLNTEPEDCGFASRKFITIITGMILIAGGAVASALLHGFSSNYGTFVNGILGIVAIYNGANIAHKFVAGKTSQLLKDTSNGPKLP